MVVHEDRKGSKQAAAQARVAKEDMWRVIVALLIVVIAISTTFNAVTVALPKLFAERLDFTKSPALLGRDRGRRLCVRRDDAIHHRQAPGPPFAEDGGAAAVLRAGAVPLSGGDAGEPAADPGLDRHRDGRVRTGHRQRRHGRQIHQRGMALARLCRALFRRLHRGRRIGRPRRVALRAGRLRHHAACLRRRSACSRSWRP